MADFRSSYVGNTDEMVRLKIGLLDSFSAQLFFKGKFFPYQTQG